MGTQSQTRPPLSQRKLRDLTATHPVGAGGRCVGVASCPEFSLEAGDVLLMVTDGVIEAESSGDQFFGDQRALEVVRANLHAPAGVIVEALHRAALDFSQCGSAQDDVTSLVVKVGPLPQGS